MPRLNPVGLLSAVPHLRLCLCADVCVRAPCSVGWAYEIIQSAPNKEINASPKKYADNFKWKGPKGRNFPDLYKPPPPPPPPANK